MSFPLAPRVPVAALALCAAACLALGACGKAADGGAGSPVAVSEPDAGADASSVTGAAEDALARGAGDVADPNDVAGPQAGGGLWVVDANGGAVGVLVSRGHPYTQNDPLQDAVTVFSPKGDLFFSLRMSSGKVIVPKMGVSDGACGQVVVAGNYPNLDGVLSGVQVGVAFKGDWYRVKPGEPLSLVPCAGTTSEGDDPKCVPHSGSCRGFPVEKLPDGILPASFPAPLKVVFVAGK